MTLIFQDLFDSLVTAFNRGSLDVPSGLLTPQTTFSLNGRSYESILDGSPDDPWIRLLARGVGGYRTAAKALQYALQQPTIAVESLSESDAGGVRIASLRFEGRLRHTGQPFEARCSLSLACEEDRLTAVGVNCSDADLAAIAAARQ